MGFLERFVDKCTLPEWAGHEFLMKGQYVAAIDALHKVVQGSPDNADETWWNGFDAMNNILLEHGDRPEVRQAFNRLSSKGYAIATWILAREAIQKRKTLNAIQLCATAYRQGLKEAAFCIATLAEYNAPAAENALFYLRSHPVDEETATYFNQILHGDLPYYQGLFYEALGLDRIAKAFYGAACARQECQTLPAWARLVEMDAPKGTDLSNDYDYL